MDGNAIEVITGLIGSIGFPIVMCFFLWKYINTTMADFTKTMAENTRMLTKICEKLDVTKKEKGDDNNE